MAAPKKPFYHGHHAIGARTCPDCCGKFMQNIGEVPDDEACHTCALTGAVCLKCHTLAPPHMVTGVPTCGDCNTCTCGRQAMFCLTWEQDGDHGDR